MKKYLGNEKEEYKLILIIEGHFTGSKEYWKQRLEFETMEELKAYLKKEDYDNFEIYEQVIRKII